MIKVSLDVRIVKGLFYWDLSAFVQEHICFQALCIFSGNKVTARPLKSEGARMPMRIELLL